jgi:hypothetical protein
MNTLLGYALVWVSLFIQITGTRMGLRAVRYIDIDYRDRYHCPSNKSIFDSSSLNFTTLYLNTARSNTLYEQCVDSLLAKAIPVDNQVKTQ